jgi:alkylation response protein AidB-like acyl-CoA dehydrogenase
MDFLLGDEQRMILEEGRAVLAEHCRPADVRRWQRDGIVRPPELWRRMGELGWLGFAVPAAHGGAGAAFFDVTLLAQVCGTALVPTLFGTTTSAALAVASCGSEAQQRRHLPPLARGETTATVAIAEADALYDRGRMTTVLTRRGAAYELSGVKHWVENGAHADWLLVAARSGDDGPHPGALVLVVVERTAPGLTARPLATFGGDAAADLVFEGVAVAADAILEGARTGFDIVLQQMTTLVCAEMLGGFERVLELTTTYVKEREQFGRPIGTFQAVQHALADMATSLEGARYATYQAAWRLARGLPAARAVAIAKAWTSPAFKQATLTAHQLHGGMGFVTEYPLHLYSNRAKAYETRLGVADRHLETLADRLCLPGGR